MSVSQPNPDPLTARIGPSESKRERGKLKIFLGAAPGVGKTYAMLEAARQQQSEGVDVVAGIVETHGRAETEALLADLEQLPRRVILDCGAPVREFDADAALERHPALVLVDELEHTNAPCLPHPKRWQSVQELLDAGIHVYTTLEIEHLESLKDIVTQITGLVVRETIPDWIVEQADEIELIDLSPDDLLKRLQEGKVYIPPQNGQAMLPLFRKGNLMALRELALRRTAVRVDSQMRGYMRDHAIPGPWPATERLLVCLSASPLAEHLVRSTRHLADALHAEWFALYIETADDARLSQVQRDQLARSQRLAEELGGRVLTLPGQDVVADVLDTARRHNITKIVAGKPQRPRWLEFVWGSFADRLIRKSGEIDVYVVTGKIERANPVQTSKWRPHRPFQRYLYGLALVIAATVVGSWIDRFISPANLVMLYLLAVVATAFYWGRGPAVVASLLGVLAFDFFLVPPRLSFTVADGAYLLTFVGLLVVGLVISQATEQFRGQVEAAQRREVEMSVLYSLSRDLAIAGDLDSLMKAIVANMSETFGRQVVVLLPVHGSGQVLTPYAQSPNFELDSAEIAVAVWSFQHAQAAGRGTDTLPSAKVRYLPLQTAHGVLGVLGIAPADPTSVLSPDQRRLLDSFASLAAVAIERAQLAEAARSAQVLEATEKLQTALLNSISHDLRTPLVSVTGVLTSLQDEGTRLDDPTRQNLIDTAREEAERLNRLVGNLLDMSRIEAGAMRVVKEPAEVQDLIGSALEQMGTRVQGRPVTVTVPDDLPLVPMDFGLMVQVLVNLIENAVKYSERGTPIELTAQQHDDQVEIRVADRGVGIPREDLDRVFDKFYRVQRPSNVSGTGMGLAICKGIVEAHGGRIEASNRAGGGTIIHVTQQLDAQPTAKVKAK